MLPNLQFLHQARLISVELLAHDLLDDELSETLSQLKLTLTSGVICYIRYNEYGEYGYQILHSQLKNDFSRFDNFDDRWEVSTKPHHLHPRKQKEAVKSPMIGNPSKDIPILIHYIKKGTLP